MIYIDSSVALARLLFEPRAPPLVFWQAPLVSSRLLEYEVWNRMHAYGLIASHGDRARSLLIGIELLEMERPVLARALEPWPTTIRTLDALHLATLEHLRSQGVPIELASYDNRLAVAAQALGNRAGAVVTSIDPANGTARQYGFIAQQVREVLPDLVNNTGIVSPATPDGLLHLDYNGLFAPIVAAIQELNARTRDMVGRHAGPAAFGPREPRDEGRRC